MNRSALTKALTGALALVGIWRYVLLFRNTLIDDAFISMKYSAMLVDHGAWSFLPGRVSNTATSPLNVLLTAAAGLVLPSVEDAVVALTTLEFAFLLWLLLRISRRLFGHGYFGGLAFVGLATNCLLMSTLGLEGTLLTVLFVWTVDLYLAGRWLGLAAALALVALTRLDGTLLGLIYFAMLPADRRLRAKFIATYALVMVPWLLFSWIHLGSFVPDTLQIKMGQRGWGRGLSFVTGLGYYVGRYPLEILSAFALLPFAPFAWFSRRPDVRRVALIVSLYGVAHLGAYWLMGIPPYHWYYVNEVTPTVLAGSLGVTLLADRLWQSRSVLIRAALGAVVVAPAAGLLASCLPMGLPLREAPIHSNWATHAEYRDVGLWLRDHVAENDVIFNVSEMGTVSYYSQRTIVNEFSDANITYRAIVERYPQLPLPIRLAIDVNFHWRRMQPPLPPKSYTLIHLPLPNEDEAHFAARIVKAWDTSTRWVPRARLYLLRETGSGAR